MTPLWRYTPLAIPMAASVVLLIVLISIGYRQRRNPVAIPYLFFMSELLLWMSMSLLEVLTLDLDLSLLFSDLFFLGASFLPVTWLSIVLVYTDKRRLLARLLPPLLSIPVLTNLVIWTNTHHHLWRTAFYRDVTTTWFPITVSEYGPYFQIVYLPSAYLVTFFATFFLVRAYFQKDRIYRTQILMMLTALYLPVSVDILYFLGFELIPDFNAAPLLFPISGVLLGWSLLRFQFLKLTPIARERVIENMDALMVVLDHQHHVVDVNPAAIKRLSSGNKDLIGLHLQDLFPDQGDLVQRIVDADSLHDEIHLEQAGEIRSFALHLSPIRYQSGTYAGKIVLLNDITERKTTERALSEHAREIAILEERQRIARDLHDSVNQTLFSASTLADLLPLAIERKPEKLPEYALNIRQLTHGATAQMRLILLELYPDALAQTDLNAILRHLCVAHTGDTGIAVTYTGSSQVQFAPHIQMAFYRIAQEALHNTRKHSNASQINVSLVREKSCVELTIEDNGAGFDLQSTAGGHFGLRNMQQRAEEVGATLNIVSQVSQGTKIRVMKETA